MKTAQMQLMLAFGFHKRHESAVLL